MTAICLAQAFHSGTIIGDLVWSLAPMTRLSALVLCATFGFVVAMNTPLSAQGAGGGVAPSLPGQGSAGDNSTGNTVPQPGLPRQPAPDEQGSERETEAPRHLEPGCQFRDRKLELIV
jgi:hypothetical protein